MKWYHSLLIACGIALVSPQIASAKPIPAAANNHGVAGAKPTPAPVARPAMPAPAARPAPPAMPAPPIAARPPAPPRPGLAPAPVPPPKPAMGMNSRDFRKLLDSIDRERKASKKLQMARKALGSRLTSAQVKDIIAHLTYDSDRVNFACDAYRNVVDRKNWSIIQSALSFASSRRKVMACTR